MTKFLDPKFSSRPASQAYRDNFDRTFNGSRTFKKPEQPAEHRETLHKYVGAHGGDLYSQFVRCKECGNGKDHALHTKD